MNDNLILSGCMYMRDGSIRPRRLWR